MNWKLFYNIKYEWFLIFLFGILSAIAGHDPKTEHTSTQAGFFSFDPRNSKLKPAIIKQTWIAAQ